MKLEVGKYYRTRDGRTVGPMRARKIFGGSFWSDVGGAYYADGSHVASPQNDIIAEWTDDPQQDSPVRTVTRKEIVPGVYGNVVVDYEGGIRMDTTTSADDLTAAIETLTAIRDALA